MGGKLRGPVTAGAVTAGFVLLWLGTVLILVRDVGFSSMASAPLLLLLATHTAYIARYVTRDQHTYDWLNDLGRVLRAFYFCLLIIWPLPLKWYDSLAMLSLLATTNDLTAGNVLLALYYAASAASHAGHGDVLQTVGRTTLGVVAGLSLHLDDDDDEPT